MLRQQRKGSDYLSLSDFIAPRGVAEDIAGVFVATAGNMLAEEASRLKDEGDSYGSLLRQSLADRIAEATSEWLHCKVRRKLWGYSPDEKCSPAEMLRGDYVGIRPAMGYPMLPDQLLNHSLASLLPMDSVGVHLTENGAMIPSATVSGIYISHPSSRYFIVGEPGEDQLADYARRRGMDYERVREILRI